jgi:hypothetical protein
MLRKIEGYNDEQSYNSDHQDHHAHLNTPVALDVLKPFDRRCATIGGIHEGDDPQTRQQEHS